MQHQFRQWTMGYSGCDGGDLGSPENRAIWYCGIEWGGGTTAQDLQRAMRHGASSPPKGYSRASHNHAYIFHRQAAKLLCAIDGGEVARFQQFIEDKKPFTEGSPGYFKLNLFPIAFRDTSHARWTQDHADLTGLACKNEYLDFCRDWRFPEMRKRAALHKPKLILCHGKSFRADFKRAFHDGSVQFNHQFIDKLDFWWSVNADGSLVVITPFMVNRNGLTRNTSIQRFGDRIAELMTEHGCR